MDKAAESRAQEAENERIKEAGRRMREQRDKDLREQARDEAKARQHVEDGIEDEVPPLGTRSSAVTSELSPLILVNDRQSGHHCQAEIHCGSPTRVDNTALHLLITCPIRRSRRIICRPLLEAS